MATALPSPKAPRSKVARRVLWIVLVGVLSTAGWWAWTHARVASVKAVVPRRGDLAETVVTTGRVLPPARIQLGSTLMARVVDVAVDEGEAVKSGDLLIQLEDGEQRAALAQAKAAATKARVALGKVGQVSRSLNEKRLAEAQSTLELTERQWQRVQSLRDAGAVPDEEIDQARQALEAARSRTEALRVESLSLAPGGSEQAAASAAVAEASAQIQAARARLQQTRLLAPADGVVLTRSVEPGDVVQPGRTLLVIARSGATRLSVQADEKDLAVLKLGQAGAAVADALPDQPFQVRLSFIAPEVDANRGTIEVRLDVPNPPERLVPDMTVSVNIEVATQPNALILPETAVHEPKSKRPWVLVAAGGRAQRRDLTLGAQGDGLVEVRTGLGLKDRVIFPAEKIEAGQRVRPTVVEHKDAL